MTDTAAALRAVSTLGTFFALAPADGPPWRPLRALIDDPDPWVSRVRAHLGASDEVAPRIAASIHHLGLVARIVSPPLGALTLEAVALDLSPDSLFARDDGPQLGHGAITARVVSSAADAADALREQVLTPVVAPLVAAYGRRYGLSPKILWGNVASALHGTVVVLDSAGVAQRVAAAGIVSRSLRADPLVATARSTTPRFVRNSCCLWYRLPGATTCGDCVLTASPRGASAAGRG